MAALDSPRQQLLSSLQGRSLHIPDLRVIFQHWPQAVSPELDGLKQDLPAKMAMLTSSSKKLAKMQKAEFALFSACWWPTAALERGKILTCLCMWLFIWDDEIDAEVGRLSGDLKASQRFRDETIGYVRYCLGLGNEACNPPENQIIAFFKVIGDAALEHCTLEQREIIMKEMEFFLDTSEIEQRRRLHEGLPSVEEYISCRMGTSAVGVTSAFNEFAYGTSPLPMHVMEDTDMRALWDETNIIVWAVNDLLSLKKEIQQQTVDSLIPLLYHKSGSLDLSVALVVEAIEKAVRNFDRLAAVLMDRYGQDDGVVERLRCFIEASQFNCTGNLAWSLRTGRYGVCQESIAGGVTVHLPQLG